MDALMTQKTSTKIRFVVAAVLLVSCIGCDQATKSLATRTLKHSPPQSYFGDTVRLGFAENPGGFLSLGGSLPDRSRFWLFIGLNSCMMTMLVAFLCLKRQMPYALFISLLLILAGGIGNLIDRLTNNGLVTDFIVMGVGPLRTGVFNVADIAVMLGATAIICLSFRTPVDATVSNTLTQNDG